jgi:hypothetical protein
MITTNGAIEATKVGNFALNRLIPLGATQNWQNARYSAPATHSAVNSLPEVSKAHPATKEICSAVIPRKTDKTTRDKTTIGRR